MTISQIFFYLCLSFVGGIFVVSFWKIPLFLIIFFLILALFLFFLSFFFKSEKRQKLIIFGFFILFFIFGIFRYLFSQYQFYQNPLFKAQGKKVVIEGIVIKEPERKGKIQKIVVKTKFGKVLINTFPFPKYQYGDKLRIFGKLQSPPIFENFNYREYLKKEGIYSLMNWPKIKIIDKNQGNFIFAFILKIKEKLKISIYKYLPSPQDNLLASMLLGEKKSLPKDLKEKLNITGLRHITAISGLHITILTSILMTILIGVGFWRQQAFWLTLILIAFFIALTGFQPSAIRAGIMGGLFLLAQYLGRYSFSSRSIVFASTLMLFQNPLLLKSDIGFQLSFLAMIGIIHLGEIFRHLLRKLPNPFQIKEVLIMTISAQIFTFPLLIYHFGYLSFVAPLTNLLIVPFLYWILLFGLIFVIFSLFLPFPTLLALPVFSLLSYLLIVVEIFSKLPFAKKTFHFSFLSLIFIYSILIFITLKLKERQKLSFLC